MANISGVVRWSMLAGVMLYSQCRATSLELADGEPMMKKWVAPVYTPELKAAKATGEVEVFFIVDKEGQVQSARVNRTTDERLNDAALATVRQWVFSPAVDFGETAARSMRVTVKFVFPVPDQSVSPSVYSPEWPRPLPKTPSQAINETSGVYPADLVDRMMEARLFLEYEVTAEGKVGATKVLGCSNPRFVPPVLAAMEQWRYKPAMQGELPIVDKKRTEQVFFVQLADASQNTPEAFLAANGFALRMEPDRTSAFYCDSLPSIEVMIDPVYPAALAQAGTGGDVKLEFVIRSSGEPADIKVASTSDDAFALAAKASLQCCRFAPAYQGGRVVDVPMLYTWKFTPPADQAREGEHPQDRILRQLKAGEKISSAKGLDVPLKPIWVVKAIYPSGLPEGPDEVQIRVDCIVDQNGMPQCIFFKDAPAPELGWAAATAVSQWVFNRPKKNGEPVDVRIAVPVVVKRT